MTRFIVTFIILTLILPTQAFSQLTDRKYIEGVDITLEHYSSGLFSSTPKLKKMWKLEKDTLMKALIKETNRSVLMDEKETAIFEANRSNEDMYVLSYINYHTNSATKAFINEHYITIIQNVNINNYHKDEVNFERFLKKESKVRTDIKTDSSITSIQHNQIIVKYKKFQSLKQNPSWVIKNPEEIKKYMEYVESLPRAMGKSVSLTSRIQNMFMGTGYFTMYMGPSVSTKIKKITIGKEHVIIQTYEQNKKNYKEVPNIYKTISELVIDKYTYD